MFRRTSLTLLACFAAPALAADCPSPVPTSRVRATLEAAEAAYGRADIDGFRQAVTELREALPCVQEPAPPALAAQVHRVEGLSHFVERTFDRAQAAFAASRTIEPEYRFPTAMVPEGNPVVQRFSSIDLATLAANPLPSPKVGALRVDGREARDRLAGLPALVQVAPAPGAAHSTAYLWPSDPLPYASGRPNPVRLAALAAGGGVAAVGLGLLGASAGTRAQAGQTEAEAISAETRRGALLGAGGALTAIGAVGLGVSFALPAKVD